MQQAHAEVGASNPIAEDEPVRLPRQPRLPGSAPDKGDHIVTCTPIARGISFPPGRQPAQMVGRVKPTENGCHVSCTMD
jgi:hypothetical protein